MKTLLIILSLVSSLFAQRVEISADKLEADEKSGISTLIGHVQIIKGDDHISADTLIVKFDKKNKPIFYDAKGSIKFHILTKTKEFEGKADQLRYDPKTLIYEMVGNVVIKEKRSKQILTGEKIQIDRISGKSIIEGKENKPVKFIFDIKEN
ncbi:MAG: lipopolysaccharide transport periplasmic protein LptA [Sulfurospirillum sp.]|nr:MAG: lipopolysaccharide transport periplasmic protein LptA [Sulfurospirillum sp.]